MRGLLFSENYRPLFSGHETFALRQLWLKKAYDAVKDSSQFAPTSKRGDRSKNIFADPYAIVTLGVGKNMVSAIKHWAIACDVLSDKNGEMIATAFGNQIFDRNGLDPYCEHATTMWLAHWKLAGGWGMPERRTHRSSTWFWAFNHIHEQSFTSQALIKSLSEFAHERGITISPATLKRDIEVFIRCYSDRAEGTSVDEHADSMLSELGLISSQSRDEFSLRRGNKSTLTDGAFLYALIEFWNEFSPDQGSLSFETIAYEIGSPGRVFKLDEDSVAEKLMNLETITNKQYLWDDTAGLRQVLRKSPMELRTALELAYE
ncbi:DUF4007 family protein [Pseudomonas sp. F1002]|uniref:DUF4007 family protein n=1 Tax=Pseudomonas sp. F1002 TaxID=2738821 RepID=UPI0015A1877B|nr:DUF4007 family protein [Pseudomonas sp. F1002]NWB64205.1 DUF4007 family protein [Pseudomonas sp. F1002]